MDSVQGSKMHWDLNAGELYDVLLDEKKLIREINHTFFYHGAKILLCKFIF